ncbi:G patch domain-containing protein 11-like isoform X1 [Salvia divinorum]|uniref:G patch domain-containing protein 11-like isoform X1 n=1 Tax=Salvia divinorum TaxID=28513 RepID=A0ABD1HFS2_SALDI
MGDLSQFVPPESWLGKEGSGRAEPVSLKIKRVRLESVQKIQRRSVGREESRNELQKGRCCYGEKENEEITEEDLLYILLQLRNEFKSCLLTLFCGWQAKRLHCCILLDHLKHFQYESVEAFESNCLGINEGDPSIIL